MAIPKIIHYCWFGSNPMSEKEKNNVSNWQKILHDYEFKLWDEQNFDINSTKFTKQVASVRKWGFIVDYVRAYTVFNYGGIYLDTDVEVIKNYDDFLDTNCFVGFENEYNVNPGSAFGGEKGCMIALEMMMYYANYNFINDNGSLNLTPSPVILSNLLLKYGFKQNNTYQKLPEITIYPCDYFSPKSFNTGVMKKTENTHSIHHFVGSWLPDEKHKLKQERWDFYEEYGNDEYIVNMYNEMKDYESKIVDNVSLKKIYKIAIRRTINKIFKKVRVDI